MSQIRCGANPYDPVTKTGDACIRKPGHDGPHAGMTDIPWMLVCPLCGGSASVPLGRTCDNHHLIVVEATR